MPKTMNPELLGEVLRRLEWREQRKGHDDMEKILTDAERQELETEARALAQQLGALLNGHTNAAIAAAIHGIVESSNDLRLLVSDMAFASAVKRLESAGQCNCAKCVAERAPKAKA